MTVMNNNTLVVLEPMFMALLIGTWVWVFYSLYNHPERLPKSKVWRVAHCHPPSAALISSHDGTKSTQAPEQLVSVEID
jgi:hypothetical protein